MFTNFLLFLFFLSVFDICSDSAQAAVMFVEAKFVSKNGVGDSLGAVTLKKAPRKRSVVSDESTVTELLERIQRTKP